VDDYKAFDASAVLSIKKNNTSISRGYKERNKLICDHCGDEGHNIERCFKLHGFPSSKVSCDHCGDKRHTIEKCFKMHGFPPGWKKGGSQSRGVRGANWNRANHIASEKELPVVDAQALEKYNSKLKLSKGLPSIQGSSTDSSYHATSQGIKQVQTYTHKPWIIDSGATNHMTRASNLFTSYTSCLGKDKVRVAYGSMVPITGRGSIRCTKTISLSPALQIPEFHVNLLSVSTITKLFNCRGWFDPSHCAFQELGIGIILGTWTVHNGLCYLDEGSNKVAFAFKMSLCEELLLRDMGTHGSPPTRVLEVLSSGPDLPEAPLTYKWARRPYPQPR
jgi:hypothetical protein